MTPSKTGPNGLRAHKQLAQKGQPMTEHTPQTRYTVRGARACAAHTTAGRPCEAPAVIGMTICQAHGGSSPQAKRAAQDRLAALVDPAITELGHIMASSDDDSVKLRAIDSILDRAGYGRNVQVTQQDAREVLYAKLLEAQQEHPGAELSAIDTPQATP